MLFIALVLVIIGCFHVRGEEVSRIICFEETSCVATDGENVTLVELADDQVTVFTFDDSEAGTVCVSDDANTCLADVEGVLGVVAASENPGDFVFVATNISFVSPVFQMKLLVGEAEQCVNSLLAFNDCIEIAEKDFDEAVVEELEQVVFLLEVDEEFPEEDNRNNNNNNDDGGFDYPIGILIFQLMLAVGFFAIAVSVVYKYDLVPARVKLAYGAVMAKKGLNKNELNQITEGAKEFEQGRPSMSDQL